ncbi:MAG TPA: glycine betaine ABC transporter substrate-binding protein [Terriglobales bacterium]|nr:glycine betaine ABC transporter substrate-binding protein [Terriglobales bacterium]
MTRPTAIAALAVCLLAPLAAEAGEPIRVGSKAFTESVILAEVATLAVRRAGGAAEHVAQLGGTRVLFSALERGEIDVYPEYSGTIAVEILGAPPSISLAAMEEQLARRGLLLSRSLGFENTYALGMREAAAAELGVRRISDLHRHPRLRFGFTNEFLDRADGWPGLRAHYRLPHQDVRGLEHDLAYRGLAAATIDVTDLYSTDADIRYYGLRVLEDDRGYFPAYDALWLMRAKLREQAAVAYRALLELEGSIEAEQMIGMNARAKLDRVPEQVIAADFLAQSGERPELRIAGRAERIATRTVEHLTLVSVSLLAAILIGLPLGVAAFLRPRLGQGIVASVGLVQTIPSLALLVGLIPLLGIGTVPALVALFLYGLLPIVRNTHAGLADIAPPLRESAAALGLGRWQRLRFVELPLAAPLILAGIKTAAVINVGTATLGALVGAGGYGQPILTGIRLDDAALILEGAIPSAVMALALQLGFERLEKIVVPRDI